MNLSDPRPVPGVPSTVHEDAWDAVVRSVRAELSAAQDRLATPHEIAPLRHRLAALESLRRHL